jgi:AcrR family transcriptional regulator
MDTRTVILNAAVDVFAQHGFRGSTTRRIADAASVNEVTIFRYFGSKEALLQEAINESDVSAFSNPLPRDPENPLLELTRWCTAVMTHLQIRSSVIRKCMGEMEERPELSARAAEAPTRATNELCAYFSRLEKKGLTHDHFDASAAASMLIASLFHDAMGREMMPDIYPKPATKAPGRYARLILHAIGVNPDVTGATAPATETKRSARTSTPTI